MEKLESYVIDNALKEKIAADFKEQVESVNDALERLKAEDIPCDLPTLKKIMSSDESFKKWLVKAEDEFIGKLGFLPMEERKRIGVSFANVFKRTANDRNTVASFLSDPKYPIVQGKDGSLQYDWQEVEKGAEQRATRHFTDEDVEYFGMLRKVVESLEDLEAWETEHAYSHFKDWIDPFAGLRNPSIHGAPVMINHGGHIDILMNPDFKNWFQRQIGKTLGKMNPEALRMIREMADEDQ